MMRKYERYEDAIKSIESMKLIYEPHLHSKVLVEVYVTDHCSEILSTSVSWLCYFDRKEEALGLWDYIVEQILPEIGEREFMSLTSIIYPICLCFKDQGTDKAAHALELYEKHIIQPMAEGGKKTHPVAIHMATPMMIILNCLNSDGEAYASAKDDIVYMMNEKKMKSIQPTWILEQYRIKISLFQLFMQKFVCVWQRWMHVRYKLVRH